MDNKIVVCPAFPSHNVVEVLVVIGSGVDLVWKQIEEAYAASRFGISILIQLGHGNLYLLDTD